MTTSHSPDSPFGQPVPRGFQMRAEVRLFHTNQDLACREDPDLFFDPDRKRTATTHCADCPFRGRCGYNAVAMGATHGIWGGVNLPGDIPNRLRPVYARLAAQFEQRRHLELGDAPVAPLPDADEDDRVPHHPGTRADPAPDRPGPVPPRWPLITSRTA
jgi:WhiB family transcriptional regulator, redox-sensing transcriptional regulator